MTLEAPSGTGAVRIGLALLLLSGVIAAGSVMLWNASALWNAPRFLFGAGIVLTLVLFISSIASMLQGVEMLRSGMHALRDVRVIECSGPCRLIQGDAHRWELRLDLAPGGSTRPPAVTAMAGHADAGSSEATPASWCSPAALVFPLDEAHAAELSHLFDPEEVLRLRWVDFPASLGGRALLAIGADPSGVVAPSAAPVRERHDLRRAA
jgi:hypothetical protein